MVSASTGFPCVEAAGIMSTVCFHTVSVGYVVADAVAARMKPSAMPPSMPGSSDRSGGLVGFGSSRLFPTTSAGETALRTAWASAALAASHALFTHT